MALGGGILTWILVSDGVSDIAFRMSGNLESLYLEQVGSLSVEQIGLLGSIFAVAYMFMPLLSGRMVDRFGERVPLAVGFLTLFVGRLIFLQAHAFEVFAVSWIVTGFSVGLLDPAYQSLISKVVPARLLGTFSGVFYSSLGFISLPAPWLGAQLWEGVSPQMPFLFTAIASLAILPVIWFKFKLPKKAAAGAPAGEVVIEKAAD